MGISYAPTTKRWNVSYEKTDYQTDLPTSYPTDNRIKVSDGWKQVCEGPWWRRRCSNVEQFKWVDDPNNEVNRAINEQNARTNTENATLNTSNTAKNQAYDSTVAVANRTAGGDYVAQRDTLKNLQGIDTDTKETLENYFKTFYRTEKLQQWDPALGAKPQYGDFDPKYYKTQNPDVAQKWQAAVANDDIDITERYGENGYYLQHYTTQGKPAGLRGNAAEVATQAKEYIEKKPTDQDLQAVRSLQLGVDTDTQTQRLLNVPAVAAEWEKAKNNDPYWDKLAKEKFLDVSKPDEFAALFRLSDRPEDKQVAFNYNVNMGYGITELEDAINQAVGEKATIDVKKFGALAQNVLKDTIAEMVKVKQKEQTLSMLSGFGSFGEISNINKTLSDSILNDTGVGGVLAFTSAGKAEESLLNGLKGITGVQNSNTYNWQKWFDDTLKAKYSQAQELGYTKDQATQMVNVEADFAKDFIDKYLVPRFNTSRSMNEFAEYLDVRQSEQNPFQTQDLVNAVQMVANLRSQQYLDSVKTSSDKYFDSAFYFNPTGDKSRESQYQEQAQTVAQDWEAAKNGDPYWAQQAYRFGVDVNDKDAFARMHFQVKGQGQGYDAAEDILNAGKVSDQIYNNILPALKAEALKQGTIFGQFITPDEFANEMLKGVDPTDTQTWNEVLKRYGLTDFKGTLDDLKEYIKDVLRTGSAAQIRSEIKYLNEKREKPTQEKLGLMYIERPEDYTNQMAKPQTELFKVFQSAGYQGSEDEFYTKFFPDVDRSEQTLLTKAGSGKNLELNKFDTSDPFAALGSIESFFPEESTTSTKTKTSSEDTSTDDTDFFKLGWDNEEDGYQKSKSGEQILGEFTSMFKGFG